MSATPPDDTLARLNYFNGQRLAAGDLRTEQKHHIGMRRVLNRSLYSPGIVTGLEVEPDKADPAKPGDLSWKHRVVVRHGLAFDHLGREIFLPADMKVQVSGAPSTTPGIVFGNLLVIAYREQRGQPANNRCLVGAPYQPCSGDLAWGAPTRILADATFEFLDSWPAEDSGKIVLSQVELGSGCQVVRTAPGVRRYAVPVKPQTVRPISLEGEKDIDQSNPKVLYFHIDGGVPDSVVLHLRSRPFNTLYYTELGKHTHAISFNSRDTSKNLAHFHTATAGGTDSAGDHTHTFTVDDGEVKGGIDVNSTNGDTIQGKNPIDNAGAHTHKLEGLQLSTELGPDPWVHHHLVEGDTASTGVSDLSMRPPVAPATSTNALRYLVDLRVVFDETDDITDRVLDQLRSKPGQAASWPALGDAVTNALALSDGTGEIDLLKIPGLEIGQGRHTLTFRVAKPAVGGTLQYNLYVG
jgi:hypothetical protein